MTTPSTSNFPPPSQPLGQTNPPPEEQITPVATRENASVNTETTPPENHQPDQNQNPCLSTETGNKTATSTGSNNSDDSGDSTSSEDAAPLFHKVTTKKPNIVIFGETGTGKSSIINMLADKEVAKISNAALGCTFTSTPHDITIDGSHYTVWDTAGLNEEETGNVPAEQALQNLQELVGGKLKDGISLLVYCIRGSRYRKILKVNYSLFVKTICQGVVPVVVVVTGLENQEPSMDAWWDNNHNHLAKRGLEFKGHACITTSRGKQDNSGQYIFEEEYGESKIEIRRLIKTACPLDSGAWVAWEVNGQRWLNCITSTLESYYVNETSLNSREGHRSGESESHRRKLRHLYQQSRRFIGVKIMLLIELVGRILESPTPREYCSDVDSSATSSELEPSTICHPR